MKKILLIGLFLSTTLFLWAQKLDYLINVSEVKRIIEVLAADEMEGRRIYTAGIEKAADFIESEFKAIGLRTFDANDKYRQSFMMIRPVFISASAVLDGVSLDPNKLMVITCQPHISLDKSSEYEIEQIKAGKNLFREASKFFPPKKNTLVVVDESYAADFGRLVSFKRSIPKTDKNIIFVLTNNSPENFAIEARHEIREQKLSNIIGVLPGKSKKNEIVIFSAHYDHLGTGKPEQGDSIYNGANDNASGTTAVIMLARYFREMKNNERTLVFAAFTAEEAGGFGSRYFSRQLDAGKIAAMFNIEMIGTESRWGKQSAYITGFDKSDMGKIMQKNLEGTGFSYYPDPYTDKQLFYRSDNATLARLGVPAHTISTSRMDLDSHYHKVTDHVETLDLDNMAQIIKSIALSATGIVGAKETPLRVKPEDLR
ncbi:MAG TPA: M28 family peptidase [Chitinophagaceae bacterium]|nr:M28 family peptidase [Chitinophagaceae bacterium]